MQPPLIPTPMTRIGIKKSAVLSFVAFATASALFITGCKKPEEKANEAIAADIKDAESSVAGDNILGQTTATLSATSTSIVVDADAAAKLAHQVGNSGSFVLMGKGSTKEEPAKAVVKYSAINPDGHITIAPAGKMFPTGSLVLSADGYAQKILATSLKDAMVSPQQKAVANMAVGLVEVREADALLHKIDVAQNHLERLLGHVAVMSTQLQANDVRIGGLTIKEPTKALAEIDKSAASAKTGDNGVWYPNDGAPILAQTAIEKSIADLKTKSDALEARHADLEKQRNDALAKAEKLSSQSELAKGKQSVDLFVEAANQRKVAGDLSIQMDDAKSQLLSVNLESKVGEAQLAQIKTALTRFDDEHKQVSAGWEGVKKQIADVVANSKMIVTGEGAPPPVVVASTQPSTQPAEPIEAAPVSLNDAADKIADVSAELDKLRKDAKDHLAKADEYFAAAAKLNKEVIGVYNNLMTTHRESSSQPGWQWMIDLHTDADPTLQLAQVQQRLARLYADEVYYSGSKAAIEKAVQAALSPADAAVKAALDQGAVVFPVKLDPGTLDADITAARDAANAAFEKAETHLKAIIGNPTTNEPGRTLIESARVAKMIEQYARYAFATAIKDPKADGYKNESIDLASKLTTEGKTELPLPLPPEIAPAPAATLTAGAPTTTVSTTQPSDTTQPATAPAATQESPATAPATSPAAPDAATPAAPPVTPAPAIPATPPVTPAPATSAPTTGTPAAPATSAPTTGTPAAPATPPAAPGTESK